MLDATLLLGLVVFVVVINRWLRTSIERDKVNDHRDKGNFIVLAPFILGALAGCGNNANDSARDVRDTVMRDTGPVQYEEYFTQEDLDSLKNVVPDSVGKVFSSREYEGMRLFMKNCNGCHPGGEQGKGPSLIDKNLPDFLIHFQVRQGLGDMPSFTKEQLPKEDVKKIVLFLKALREDYPKYLNDPDY